MADKKSLLSLNLGSQRVSLARFTQAKGGLVLQDYASTELMADPAADSARVAQTKVAVAELAAKIGHKTAPVRCAISGHAVFSRFVKLPPMSDLDEDKVKELVTFEARQHVPFQLEEVKWDYQLITDGSDGGEIEAVIVAIKSDSINEYSDAVEESGLSIEGVDVAPMAIYNAFRYNYSDVEIPALVIDVGARTTNLIYVDGGRIFTRSLPEGGAAATSAIAKEFGVPFIEAEEMKVRDGFVSLGGNYADHDDPQIAAMSKVIRQTMTRLHSNVVRTTSSYRQTGGRAPEAIYLCGGSASLPYLREFFMEKLDLPVEYFNGVRNVSVGSKVDTEALGADAHNLGELAGLGLRGISSCPIELDLVPDALERRRDLKRRKPFLITAGCCTLATLLAAGVFFSKAKAKAESEMGEIDIRLTELRSDESQIKKELNRIKAAEAKADPLRLAIHGRTQMVEILDFLNAQIPNEKIWFTQIEPLSGGDPLEEAQSLFGGQNDPKNVLQFDDGNTTRTNDRRDSTSATAPKLIDGMRIYGLYRSDSANAFQLLRSIRQNDPGYFNFEGLEDKDIIKILMGEQHLAQPFGFNLPLKTPLEKPVLEQAN